MPTINDDDHAPVPFANSGGSNNGDDFLYMQTLSSQLQDDYNEFVVQPLVAPRAQPPQTPSLPPSSSTFILPSHAPQPHLRSLPPQPTPQSPPSPASRLANFFRRTSSGPSPADSGTFPVAARPHQPTSPTLGLGSLGRWQTATRLSQSYPPGIHDPPSWPSPSPAAETVSSAPTPSSRRSRSAMHKSV
jgi:hypothetical protein